MASRYLSAGYSVLWRSEEQGGPRTSPGRGPQLARHAARVAQSADIVFTSIPNDDVLQEIASGDDGIQAGLEEGRSGWM